MTDDESVMLTALHRIAAHTRHPGPVSADTSAALYAIAVSAIAMVAPRDPIVLGLYETTPPPAEQEINRRSTTAELRRSRLEP